MSAEVIIAIGASAGGVSALTKIFRDFPATDRAAFFLTVHVPARSESLLPKILSAAGNVPAEHPTTGRKIEPGRIYVAPPDHHLIVEDGLIRLDHGPRQNRHRPGINPMFRSLAEVYRKKVAGVILTGLLDDGTAGLADIKEQGGLAIVQDPKETTFPGMPINALSAVNADLVAGMEEIREVLIKLSHDGGAKAMAALLKNQRKKKKKTAAMPKRLDTIHEKTNALGPPVGLICPDCNGPLWETTSGRAVEFQCVVGHSFSPDTLNKALDEELERALWVALRTLEERIELQQRLGFGQPPIIKKSFHKRARENQRHARLIRQLLEKL